MDKKDLKISLVINIIITILTIFASIAMFTGFKFMSGYDIVLQSTGIYMLRFFTVESNMFMGIVSLIFAIDEISVLKGKKKEISAKKYILKLMATVAVSLTFFVVFTYLGPIAEHGLSSLLMNSNLFFHLIIPILSILTFVLFERTDKLKFRYTFYGIVPSLLYGVYYLINILVHMENGKVSPIYDWYWFVQNGIWTAVIVAPMLQLITYVISLIIWKLNRKTKKLEV